jgi:hypothetical protein
MLVSNLLRKMRKICQQKSYRQKMWAKLEIVLFYTTNFEKFLASHFFCVNLKKNYLKSAIFCIFGILIYKKRIKKIWGSLSNCMSII